MGKRQLADDFCTLVTLRWNDDIAKISRRELETRKWNKPQLLPLTEDLKKLKDHLASVKKQAIDQLARDNGNVGAWRNLCSVTLANLILLNRRRQGEASKFKVVHLQELSHGGVMNEEVKKSLSSFELQLCKTFKRVEIRGKRGRKVPMLVTKALESAMKLILQTRESVGVNPNNIYLFAIPTANSLHFLRGSDALRKHAQLSSLKCPQSITSTKLRKHVATLSQLINLEENELEMLARFLGHDIKVHREFYRLPEDCLQTAKCGKLLLLMDQGNVGDFSGKSLKDIEINMSGKPFLKIVLT